jgi:hypothetical protein
MAPKRPDPEVAAKAKCRQFSAEYRLRILKEADACKGPVELAPPQTAPASWRRIVPLGRPWCK